MANFDQWWNNDESIQDNADTLKQRGLYGPSKPPRRSDW